MPLYPVVSSLATAEPGEGGGPAEGSFVVAVWACGLVSPAGRPLRPGERSALVVGGTEKIRGGELAVFCKVVAVAPAVVRRDGRVQAEGKPYDYARLGVLEEHLDAIAGPDAIGRLARSVRLDGKVKGLATRLMTTAFALRAILLMTLMPAGYSEVMTALAGDLAAVPWSRAWHMPSATVLSAWRDAIGPEPLESLQQVVLTACCADHRGPRLPGRPGRRPARRGHRRDADADAGHPGQPRGLRVGGHGR